MALSKTRQLLVGRAERALVRATNCTEEVASQVVRYLRTEGHRRGPLMSLPKRKQWEYLRNLARSK